MYMAVSTRPDITASVTILSRKIQNPTEADWKEAERIARYLKGTINYALKLGNNKYKDGLIRYADADWGENRTDRKSNCGYIFRYCVNSISWASRKQSCVALSSAEDEYISLSEACQEGLWLIKLLKEFQEKMKVPLLMYENNQSCIKLTGNNKFSKRTKHIDIRFHHVKVLAEGKVITIKYCDTNNMLADLLTEPLRSTRLKKVIEDCGLIPLGEDDNVEEQYWRDL